MKKIIFIGMIFIGACAKGPQPKDVVFEFIDAVKSSDSLRVAQILDIDSYIKSIMTEMSPSDSAQVLIDYRAKTIKSLLGNGEVRLRWMRSLIVVNKEEKQDSTAEVEVSFIDQALERQLYTKMQLHQQPNGGWKITYFK
jgi:hypothetical protein